MVPPLEVGWGSDVGGDVQIRKGHFDTDGLLLGDRCGGHANDSHGTNHGSDVLRFGGDVGLLDAVDEAGLRVGLLGGFGVLGGHGFAFLLNEWSFSI